MGALGDAPESCDCCGRDAEDCGMLEHGWVRDTQVLAGSADFCRACAHLLRISRLSENCSWCGAALEGEDVAETAGWAYFADEIGAFHPCCPRCLGQRFGISVRVDRTSRFGAAPPRVENTSLSHALAPRRTS